MEKTEQKTKKLLATLIILTFLTVNLTFPSIISYASPTIKTEKSVYGGGETLNISGTATPNTDITIQLFDPAGRRKAIAQASVNSEGLWSKTNIYTFTREDLSGRWIVKVYDTVLEKWAETPFIVDVTPPKITITLKPEKKVYGNETVTILVDSNEKICKTTVTVIPPKTIPQTVNMLKVNQTRWVGTLKIKPEFEGKTTIKVQVEDKAGNIAEKEKSFIVDVTPPKITITEIPAKTKEPTIIVEGTVSEPIPEVKILVPGLPPVKAKVDKEKLIWKTEVTLKATGLNIVKAYVTDEAGNIGEDQKVVYYIGPIETIKTEIENLKETMKNEVETIKTSVNTLGNLLIVAVILSIIAATFSITAVIIIARRIVLK
ncbi:MAG: hypothetical protein DRO36_03930 [Candidatus Hecatellales archaeon]|nr:MAG: hypothetical protein DRO36_03930 [Candidatus Hecatellales archaeon]